MISRDGKPWHERPESPLHCVTKFVYSAIRHYRNYRCYPRSHMPVGRLSFVMCDDSICKIVWYLNLGRSTNGVQGVLAICLHCYWEIILLYLYLTTRSLCVDKGVTFLYFVLTANDAYVLLSKRSMKLRGAT